MTTTAATSPSHPVPPPVVELRGPIAQDLADYARDKVRHVLERGAPVVGPARVRVVRHPDPARPRPVVAAAHVDLAGRRLHAHVVAETPREAVDLLVDRLRRQVTDAPAATPTAAPAQIALALALALGRTGADGGPGRGCLRPLSLAGGETGAWHRHVRGGTT